MYFDSTIILLIPAIIFSIIAQTGIKTTFGKYSRIKNMKRITGAEAARIVLENNGLGDVSINPVAGDLTDNYDQ